MWCSVIYIVLKKCYFLTHTIFYRYVSSNVNEGIRAVLNHFYLFLREDFTCTKSIKTHISEQKQKRQHFNAFKKHLRGKKSFICLFAFLCFLCFFCAFLCFLHFMHFLQFLQFLCFVVFVLFMLFVHVKSSCKKNKSDLKLL